MRAYTPLRVVLLGSRGWEWVMLPLTSLAPGTRCFAVRCAALCCAVLPAVIPTATDWHCFVVDQFAAAPQDALGWWLQICAG